MIKLPFRVVSQQKQLRQHHHLQSLHQQISSATHFVKQIGQGQYNEPYPHLDDEQQAAPETLPGALIAMRNQLKHLNQAEQERKWTTEGLAQFGDILRLQHNNLEELCQQILSNLVRYLQANQGSLFVVDETEKVLEMKACYAYDKKKYIQKKVEFGEGLVGQTYLEKETTFLTEVPANYVAITSGLGHATPRNLVIVPLKINHEVKGILELATFKPLQPFQIAFLERLGESIASTFATAQINEKTKWLLKQSQLQAEELRSQEEELKQNLEEMQATQEELARKEAESRGVLKALNTSHIVLELNSEGYILSVNELFRQFMQQLHDGSEVIGKLYGQISQSEAGENTWEAIWKAVVAGQQMHRTATFRHRTSQRWLYETYSPIFDNHQRLQKVLLIATDITENKLQEYHMAEIQQRLQYNMEELQRKSEEIELRNKLIIQRNQRLERFGQLQIRLGQHPDLAAGNWDGFVGEVVEKIAVELQIARVSLWLLSGDGQTIVSTALYQLAERKISRQPVELSAKDFPQYFQALHRKDVIRANDALTDPATREFADGYLRPLGINSMLDIPYLVEGHLAGVICCEHIGPARTWDSDEVGFVKSLTDLITNAHYARLQQTQKTEMILEKGRIESFINSATENIFLLDLNGNITLVNDAVRQVYAPMGVQVVPGMPLKALVLEHDWEQTASLLARAAKGERLEVEQPYEFGDLKGVYLLQYFPLLSESKIMGIGIVVRDITERKKMAEEIAHQHEEIRASEEELRQNLEELTAMQETLARRTSEIERIREEEKARFEQQLQEQLGQFQLREQDLLHRVAQLETALAEASKQAKS